MLEYICVCSEDTNSSFFYITDMKFCLFLFYESLHVIIGLLLFPEVFEFVAFFSISCASLYITTPNITVNVPKPLKNVTGL